jgi:hypothetical protein
MKKLLYLVIPVGIGIALLASCKSGSTSTSTDAKKDSVVMPYKASYSSTWTMSDSSKYVQSVLQSLKDWEDNKISNGSTYFGDTVAFDLWDGKKFNLKRDSLLKIFQNDRDSLSSVKIDVAAWDNLHSTDKNQTWVGTWYKETDTYKNGKVDSAFYQDENLIKNGKIVYVMDERRTLPKGK